MQVDLDEREWQAVMQIIATKCVWVEAQPLLQKIGGQLERMKQNGKGPDDDVPERQPPAG
jgi:hypothetical protein